MFQLDDNFLKDIGLGDLPEEQKKPFLQHIYQELELRVGTKLSDGMSDEQLAEFESIVDRDEQKVRGWLADKAPEYHTDKLFLALQSKNGMDANDIGLLSEYAATKWLEINKPNYRDVVSSTLEDLKKEISSNRAAILEQ